VYQIILISDIHANYVALKAVFDQYPSADEVCCDRKTPILEDIDYLQNLPNSVSVLADGVRYLLVHDITSVFKSPRTALQSSDVDVIICGHTHIASITPVGRKKIVNAGTVGQPEDGNYRAQCMVIENGELRFDRVDYSLDELAKACAASSMPDEHRRYYLESARRGYGTRRGIRLGPFSAGYGDVN
jgi:diadenosine tetraphosphatase ApaH/serine/threonine PP2A family protein phosphatase